MNDLAETIALSTHIMYFDKKVEVTEMFGLAVYLYLVLCIKAGNQRSAGYQVLYFMVIVRLRLKPEIFQCLVAVVFCNFAVIGVKTCFRATIIVLK